eukprot:TRINITY_DN8380_c0_g1_i5.p4 TRINITY_DN8380_c0_g1~~TRINITY_DN8380_c0_g1_i5.p4  ORF type:complete len:188 (+),score=8.65 TRINITY_DN8380_c0_g1_i5:892-1455(+)
MYVLQCKHLFNIYYAKRVYIIVNISEFFFFPFFIKCVCLVYIILKRIVYLVKMIIHGQIIFFQIYLLAREFISERDLRYLTITCFSPRDLFTIFIFLGLKNKKKILQQLQQQQFLKTLQNKRIKLDMISGQQKIRMIINIVFLIIKTHQSPLGGGVFFLKKKKKTNKTVSNNNQNQNFCQQGFFFKG